MASSTIVFEVIIIIGLILINGLLAMSEMAIVSAKKIRLQQLAAKGNHGAKAALLLSNAPSDFLASIQIGITLIGVLAGAFGGATLTDELSHSISKIPLVAEYSDIIALSSIVLCMTLLSLILGELVPKRLALGDSERVATLVSRPIQLLAILTQPLVWLLSISTEAVLKLIGFKQREDLPVTEEELTMMVEQGTEAGVFEKDEESIIKRVLKIGDRRVDELMTQRTRLVCLNVEDPFSEQLKEMLTAPHSYFPVYQETKDHIIGIVSVKCILSSMAAGGPVDVRKCLTEPLYVSKSMTLLNLLERFKTSGMHLALVVDEHGGTAGIITAIDVLEGIVGSLPEITDEQETSIVKRYDGSWLVDGDVTLHEFNDHFSFDEEKMGEIGDFQTVGGFVMAMLGRIPKASEHFFWEGHRFEVMDMDGLRVDKVLIAPIESAPQEEVDAKVPI